MDAHPGGIGIDVRIPCYTINSELGNIKDILMDMGATTPFLANIADFSGISDSPLFIHKILQNTYIDVNEKGTESSAVTVEVWCMADIEEEPQGPPLFYANRPFLFFIRETGSKTNIFVGVKQ
jgi:serpin B